MWDWLTFENDGLRDGLRDADPYYMTEPIEAVKVLHQPAREYLVAEKPGHWWTAKCHAIAYNATPRNPRHRRAPDIDCSCGFYAFKREAMTKLDLRWAERESLLHRLGGLWIVELAGLVYEHERGYRAERLRLVAKVEYRNPIEVLHELGAGTTGQIREACGYHSGNASVNIRTALKAAAVRGECVEVATPAPNNHGGHMWISRGTP